MTETMTNIENQNANYVLPENVPDRKHKDRVFRMIYKDRAKALELYNGMNHSNYTSPEDLIITTLDNALYLGMKNDVSFVLYDQLLLYEHQSTVNPNMPLRNLFYVADVYSKLTTNMNLYSSTLQKIPEPHFFVFYNGTDSFPERKILRLSDAYEHQSEEPALELVTEVLNINKGFNEELKDQCRTLREYMIFVDMVRDYTKKMPFKEAMAAAIEYCIRNNVLADFLKANKAEVLKVSIYEYDEEKHMAMERDEAEERGEKRGIVIGEERGEVKGIQLMKTVLKLQNDGKTEKEIAEECGVPVEKVRMILE